ncbi:hypothetical protein [Granulicatella sp. zg-ZJ]|uniref:hypothetical protein n=1 Tax=Granulicatella sp. zg-ZJ TaxID=2678504 RepID=UPI00196713B9|nr:hypothetical protein [Granulicatella sp. zg-ZJ]
MGVKKISDIGYSGRKLIIEGILEIFVGILLTVFQEVVAVYAVELILFLLLLVTSFDLIMWPFRAKDKRQFFWITLIKPLCIFVFGDLAIIVRMPLYLLTIFVGIYQLLQAFINGVTYYIYRQNDIKPRFKFLFDACWLFILGVSALTPKDSVGVQLFILGIYLIVLGLTNLRDGVTFDKEMHKGELTRRVRVSLPIVFAALIPRRTLQKLNDYMASDEYISLELAYDVKKEEATVDLELFVHVTESGFGAIGHVDICYQNQVISYGNYDTNSERLFGMIGDGVLFKTDREKYIAFCKKESHKTLLVYGLSLDDKQRQAVEEQLHTIDALVTPWEPNQYVTKQGEQQDVMYAYKLKQETGANLFKFTSSKFKTYFVLSTNCVLLADSIVGRAGTDILNVKGFISPGTYQTYLDREFEKKHSIVVEKSVY